MQKWVSWCILVLHAVFSLAGWHCFSMPNYMQIAQTNFAVDTPFWPLLYHFHGNPPLLSVVHHLAEIVFPKQPFLFFDVLLPVLHVLAYWLFIKALKEFQVQVPAWFIALLFLNPLVFTYFRYPFYATFIFVLTSAILFALSKARISQAHVLLLASLLCICALLRSTWLPWFGIFIPMLFWKNHGLKTKAIVLLISVLPFAWQAKNYWLVGKFASSTWLGMNLARTHLPWKVHNHWVAFIPPFSSPQAYFDILTNDRQIQEVKFETNPYLNGNNLNNRVMPVVSDRYISAVIADFSWTWSLNAWLNGLLIFYKSPAIEAHVLAHLADGGYPQLGFNYDFWHPLGQGDSQPWRQFFVSNAWDPGWVRLHAFNNISFYTLIYPTLLFWMGYHFRKKLLEINLVFALTLFFTLVYSFIDIFEANRMRMEIEPFYYFMLCLFISRQAGKWKLLGVGSYHFFAKMFNRSKIVGEHHRP